MRIFIIGYMACGKSSLGPKLAETLGIPFFDLDDVFEERYKVSINDFFQKYSEKYFRKIEHSLLMELSGKEEFVIATGGGTPCYHQNMDAMNRRGITLYLKLPVEILSKRLAQTQRKRPLLKGFLEGNFEDHLMKHLSEREQYYLNSQIVITDSSPDYQEIADLIRQKIIFPNGA